MLLPDEVLSMIFVRVGKAEFKQLHLVCSRIWWQMMRRRLAATGTAGLVIAALEKTRRDASPSLFCSSLHGRIDPVKLDFEVHIQNGTQCCSMHLVQQCAAQRNYLEANLLGMLLDEHDQQKQQQQQEQSGHQQLADGAAPGQAVAPSTHVGAQVSELPRS
jgi:hypothetical protein